MYTYLFGYVYFYVYSYLSYVYTCIENYIFICIYTCIRICTCVHIHTYLSIHVHIRKCMHIYLWHICSYMCIYLYLFIRTCYFQLQRYYQFNNFHLKIRIDHAYIRDSQIIRCGDIFERAVWKCCVFSHI